MSALENLTREVEEQRTINQSAITLIQGLAQQLREAIESGSEEQLQALADSLDQSQRSLADAVSANTTSQRQQ